jgi:ArsR family transcriptional regulator
MLRIFVSSREEACLCELADSLLEPEYKLSRHLKIVRQAGLLSATKDGRWVYHRLVPNVPFLSHIYKAIGEIADPNKEFAKDLSRFRKRMGLRERDSGRCKTETKGAAIQSKATKR